MSDSTNISTATNTTVCSSAAWQDTTHINLLVLEFTVACLFFTALVSSSVRRNICSRLPLFAAVLIVIESACSIVYNNPNIDNLTYFMTDGIAWLCDVLVRLCLISFMYYRFRGLYGRAMPSSHTQHASKVTSKLHQIMSIFTDIPRLIFIVVGLIQIVACILAMYSDIGTVVGANAINAEVSLYSVYVMVDISVPLLDALVCVEIWRLKASKAGTLLKQIEFVRAFMAVVCCALTAVAETIIFSLGYDLQWEIYFVMMASRIVFAEIFNSSLLSGLVDQPRPPTAKLSSTQNGYADPTNDNKQSVDSPDSLEIEAYCHPNHQE
ncbi:hypothetical protein BASA50_010184 [Batrachochytrium salamandrivorans]|uniref:Transmembrane protein n=1 Tax=Batrachochytrium salamandrivorans TaxID=1357716 RepID=A0ABQ8EZP1_9FUNG|nr:hypothetical protein BASA50_010184 [Batrachochytrium salamandrivorans]